MRSVMPTLQVESLSNWRDVEPVRSRFTKETAITRSMKMNTDETVTKAYEIDIGNEGHWSDRYHVERKFFVFADGIMDALMEALDVKIKLLDELMKSDIILNTDLRIKSIREVMDVTGRRSSRLINGNSDDELDTLSWCHAIIARMKKD